MDLLNSVMNKVNGWSQTTDEAGVHQNWAKRHILTRAVTVGVVVPLEVLAIVDNAISAPFYALGAVCKLGTKALRICSSSEGLRKIDESLPGLGKFIQTVLRVAAYAIGAVFTATLGFLSPSANFRLHCAVPYLELAQDARQKEVKADWQKKLQGEQQRRAEEEAQAERVLAAVAAMLERVEEEAEMQATAPVFSAEKELPPTPVSEKIMESSVHKVTVIDSAPAKVEAIQPGFFKRFITFGMAQGAPAA